MAKAYRTSDFVEVCSNDEGFLGSYFAAKENTMSFSSEGSGGKGKNKDDSKLAWKVWEEKNETWVDENEREDTDMEHLNEEVEANDIAEPLQDWPMVLYTYQKKWISWALKQEESEIRGGILADEKGMGNTFQAIAFVLFKQQNRTIPQSTCSHTDPSASTSTVLPEIKCTLIVCSVLDIMRWVSEIGRFTPTAHPSILVFYGANGKKSSKELSEYDFVLTTYFTIETEFNVMTHDRSRNSVLHSVKWERLILDEAHYLKDTSSSTAKAVLALESSYKWALTDTQLLICFRELFPLVRFLQISPYSYRFCRDCDCKSLDYSSTSECQNCVHKSTRHFFWWNRSILKPIQTSGDVEGGRRRTRAIILLKHRILKSIMLRRTEKGQAADLIRPPKIFCLRRVSANSKEEDYYNTEYNSLLLKAHRSPVVNTSSVRIRVMGFKRLSDSSIQMCIEDFQNSTKIEALKREIVKMLENDRTAKGIVFSQYESFLNLISISLQQSGISCIHFVGYQKRNEIDSAAMRFIEDPECKIWLMSLKAACVTPNLTAASYVFLMDPWWNPAVERLVQDLIDQLRQYKPIRIIRLIIKDTIEERILQLLEKKEPMFKETIGGSSQACGILTDPDLRFLLNI
ncbi:DNA repair protein RAD16-like [Telopea speciosissima]|uniref:DNA repair protein RAD16-like n=1 Tax=Telopea speciosissima TaxID=54955 RepID=UPI001CC545EE|nr:DNA repair protein RAD16-like [Telopea speciosissima]